MTAEKKEGASPMPAPNKGSEYNPLMLDKANTVLAESQAKYETSLAGTIREIKKRSVPPMLKKAGYTIVNNRVLCPAHSDKHPSCTVYNDGVHCFACGFHGDAIDFFRVAETLTFIEAVKRCANLCNIAMPERHTSRMAQRCLKKGLYDFVFITSGKREISEKLRAKGWAFYEFSSFKVLDLTEFDREALLEKNIVLLPEPGNAAELEQCRLLSQYSGAEFLNWKLCPVQSIEALDAASIAASLCGGVICP